MNILFLVSGFLMIFLFFSSSLLKQAASFSLRQKSLSESMEAKRKMYNKFERYKYRLYEKKPRIRKTEGSRTMSEPIRDQPYVSHRAATNLSPSAKWNLFPLISSVGDLPVLDRATGVFLESLYGHTRFWKEALIKVPDLSERLVAAFKRKQRDRDLPEKISELFPEDPVLRQVFYKMLKGSGRYCLLKKEGYPPLEDLCRLDKETGSTITLAYACFPALEALLGAEMSEAIFLWEKEKWEKKKGFYSITKEELYSLLPRSWGSSRFNEIPLLIGYSKKKEKPRKLTVKEGKRAFIELELP